jgi:hypothetical protein
MSQIAAGERGVGLSGEPQQASIKILNPLLAVLPRRQRYQTESRLAAHGGNVAQASRQRPFAHRRSR